jgi:hypothetical protein
LSYGGGRKGSREGMKSAGKINRVGFDMGWIYTFVLHTGLEICSHDYGPRGERSFGRVYRQNL